MTGNASQAGTWPHFDEEMVQAAARILQSGKVNYWTGDEGKIYAVEVDGKETRGKKVATVEAAWVTALLARSDGTLLAASTPGGKIFSVDPKKGTSKLFATLPADHVWALADVKRHPGNHQSRMPGHARTTGKPRARLTE